MRVGMPMALLMSAVIVVGGCAQGEDADVPEETREEAAGETTEEPTIEERTVIKETTVVVVPAPAPSPEQASSPSPEVQQPQHTPGPEPVAPEVAPEVENTPQVEIPHDGTVVPCFQDPVCSSEQARIQSEHAAQLEADRANKQPGSQNLHDMCRQAVRAKTQLPEVCRSLGG